MEGISGSNNILSNKRHLKVPDIMLPIISVARFYCAIIARSLPDQKIAKGPYLNIVYNERGEGFTQNRIEIKTYL